VERKRYLIGLLRARWEYSKGLLRFIKGKNKRWAACKICGRKIPPGKGKKIYIKAQVFKKSLHNRPARKGAVFHICRKCAWELNTIFR